MKVLKPCPFCGNTHFDLNESLHPSGVTWEYTIDGTHKIYGEHRQFESHCYVFSCECGAEVYGDSEQEVISAWNTRADGWISVADEYPPEGEYLCLIAIGSFTVTQRQVVRKITGRDVHRKNTNFGDWVMFTHWMPLPELPKE